MRKGKRPPLPYSDLWFYAAVETDIGYITADCGHLVYPNEKIYCYNGQTRCRDCWRAFAVDFAADNPDAIAEAVGAGVCVVVDKLRDGGRKTQWR